jgi:hypothetical protein
MSLEPSRKEDFEYVFKIVLACVCEQNGNAKRLAKPFSRALWGEGALWDKMAHRDSGNSDTLLIL